MDERFFWLVVGILGAWRLTHLVVSEDGPFLVVARIRRAAGGGFWGRLMDCFLCASLWTSAPLALAFGSTIKERFGFWLSFSAGAILLEQARERLEARPVVFRESEGEEDVVLRKSQVGSGLGRELVSRVVVPGDFFERH